jgi:hypothetical protein
MNALTIAAQDSATMLWREIKHSVRLLRLLIVSAILVPVVLLLLFDYILGGTLGHGLGGAARGAPYIDYLVAGILVMTVAGGCGPTAINVTMDMTGGFVDRIRTMAVTRGALLAGHVGVSVLRMLVATAAVTGVALLLGFRPRASVADWFAVVGIVAAFSFALAWLSAAIGLVTKTVAARTAPHCPCRSCFHSCPALSCRPTRCLPECAGSPRINRSPRWWTASAACSPARRSATPHMRPLPGARRSRWRRTCGRRSRSTAEPVT